MPISKSAQTFAKIFGAIIVTGFILGLVAGVQGNEDAIAAKSLANLELVNGSGTIRLMHKCGEDAYTHAYDVATGRLRIVAESRRNSGDQKVVAVLRSEESLLIATIGGASGGWNLARSMKTAAGSRSASRRVLAKGFFVFSGYAAGYFLVYGIDTSCNSESTRRFLGNKESWRVLEKAFAVQQMKELGFGSDEWLRSDETMKDRHFRQSSKSVVATADQGGDVQGGDCISASRHAFRLVEALEDVDYDPNSADFELIRSIETLARGSNASANVELEPCLELSRFFRLPKLPEITKTTRRTGDARGN